MTTEVALFIHSFEGGGAERVAVLLANEIARKGYSTDLVVQWDEGPHRIDVSDSVRIVELGCRLRWLPIRFRGYLRANRPTAVLSFMTGFNIIASLLRSSERPERLVLSERNPIQLSKEEKPRWERLGVPLIGVMYRRADGVVALSESIRTELVKLGVPPRKVVFIPNPVDISSIRDSINIPATHRFFESRLPVLVGVGRLVPQKDFATLIRATALVQQHLEVRLLILGEGPERGRLTRLVGDLSLAEVVDLPGYVSPPWPWMAKSSLVVMSSRFEGWGNVLAEALALGIPVVSTDAPTGPREILEDGRLGRLVTVGSPTELAEAIFETLDNPPPQYALMERADEWSASQIADRYLDVLGFREHVAQ